MSFFSIEIWDLTLNFLTIKSLKHSESKLLLAEVQNCVNGIFKSTKV